VRDFIASRSPRRNRFGEYREQSATATGLGLVSARPLPLVYLDDESILLPGHRMTLSLEGFKTPTENKKDKVFLVVGRRNAEQLCLARVIQMDEENTKTEAGHHQVLVEGQSRVLLEQVKGEVLEEIEERLLCRSSPLMDRWLYFRVLDQLTTSNENEDENEAILNLSDALEDLLENVELIASFEEDEAETNKWKGVTDFVMQDQSRRDRVQDGSARKLSRLLLLERSARASFAALQSHRGVLLPPSSSSLASLHQRAMRTTDLGERMELAVNHTKQIKDKIRLNQNFKL
jgi:hypothetical protein